MAAHLYESEPTQAQGNLSKLEIAITQSQRLFQVGEKLGIERLLERSKGIPVPTASMIANALEAVIGAIYEDSLNPTDCENFVYRHVISYEEVKIIPNPIGDLYEFCARNRTLLH